MDPITFLAGLLAFWSFFHLVYNLITQNLTLGTKFTVFLIENNIGISLGHVRWFTKRWNRIFLKFGKSDKFPWKLWFNFGIVFAVIAMGLSMTLLCRALYNTLNRILFKSSAPPDPNEPVLTVIVPGINLPLEEIGYLIIAVFISGILHECGHAIAAAYEGIYVNGFGMFVFILYPGAYVDFNSKELSSVHSLRQLRIYCAGVWHNFLTCIFACFVILSLPYLLLPLYSQTSTGALVIEQSENSPLNAPTGLHIGNYVTQIDDCKVSSVESWFYCLNKTKLSGQKGSCLNQDTVETLQFKHAGNFDANTAQQKWLDCCGNDSPATHICYNYWERDRRQFSCLPGRSVLLNYSACNSNHECLSDEEQEKDVCYFPFLAPGVSFIHFYVQEHNNNRDVLFVGNLADIYTSVKVSNYVPRFFLIPYFLPDIFLRFWQYMFSISGALALLNIVPSYALDGQWAFTVLLDYGLKKYKARNPRFYNIVLNMVLLFGTSLLASNIIVGFYSISFSNGI